MVTVVGILATTVGFALPPLTHLSAGPVGAGAAPGQTCVIDADCDDGSVCTGLETCVDELCTPGAPLDCDDGNPCTDDTCDAVSGCGQTPNDANACDDGIVCTAPDVCSAGVCSGTPIGGCAGVVINELMYHPPGALEPGEFIELYNMGSTAIDVSGWFFDGIDYVFPPGTSIAAGGYVVLADDVAAFSTTYGAAADGVYTGQLANGGETIRLFDAGTVLVDQVTYDDAGLWPITPDGEGPSAERIAPLEAGSDPRNWDASSAPTPGAPNSVLAASLPPWIAGVDHPIDPLPGSTLTVTATVLDATTVEMHYVIDFGAEVPLTMLDDGLSGDGASGDGVFGATIPGQLEQTLVRFRITVNGPTGTMTWPRDDDPARYDGTVVADPALVSALPIFHWLMDPDDWAAALAHKFTDLLEPAVLYYDGVLYDNCQVRVRGQSSRSYPKNHWKVHLPRGHDFFHPAIVPVPVDQFNLQGNYSDKAFMREQLCYESFKASGAPFNHTRAVRVQRDGAFFGLYTFLQSMDDDYLETNDLDPNGAWYKAFSSCQSGSLSFVTNNYQKKTRLHENHADLHAFLADINSLDGAALTDFIFDNVDIPGMANYLATTVVIHNTDFPHKNYFIYRDTEGTGRWTMHPWDEDLSFGRNWQGTVLNDEIWADRDSIEGRPPEVSPSHPLVGEDQHKNWDTRWNRWIDKMYDEPWFLDIYYRRLRTLMDALLVDGYYEARIDEIAATLAPEAALDPGEWGQYGQAQTLQDAIDLIKNDYLAVRRVHLFATHQSPGAIPPAQSSAPVIVINELMYHPATAADDEFVELYNPSPTEAVDLSGWRLEGLGLTLPPGAVILPDDFLLVVRNDVMFRAVYGSGHYVAAEYGGALSNEGEVLRLLDRNGLVVDEVLYDDVFPWPVSAAGSGPSLELIDVTQDNNRVVNWLASLASGGTPGAPNSVAGLGVTVADVHINEVAPVNAATLADEQGEFDPWLEIYNAGAATVDLGALFLTDDFGVVDTWALPEIALCGSERLLVWCDADTAQGPAHANFTLDGLGGVVALYDSSGNLVDYLDYPALSADHSYGKLPDGGSGRSTFLVPTPLAPNVADSTGLILNEYNAVRADRYLGSDDFGGSTAEDTFFGRVQGNGGNWFELVVTSDHLDVRGWELLWVEGADSGVLTLSNDPLWSDVRRGTILTVTELTSAEGGLDTDAGYDPAADDWWINVNSFDAQYVTTTTTVPGDGPGNFSVGNDDWQLTIVDASATVVFGPAGEGIGQAEGVNSREVLKLEDDPSAAITPLAAYNDGTSSTFGGANLWGGGAAHQEFTALRSVLPAACIAVAECADGNPCTDDDCAGGFCAYASNTTACNDGDSCTTGDACSGGVCAGSIVPGCCASDCACDDGDDCTIDSCVAGACQTELALDGTACSDGDPCTIADSCDAGACAGVAMDCSALDDQCTQGVCVAGTGACQAQPANEGLACDDGLACTSGDSCAAGVCSGNPTDCSSLDTACTQGVCDEGATGCVSVPINDGGGCDDEVPCTTSDMCAAGVCSGVPVDCSSLDEGCTVGVCDDPTGQCIAQDAPDGLACSDGDACTVDDACLGGVCVGSAACPVVAGAGARYLAMTPVAGLPSVALRVESSTWPCVSAYVDAGGRLVDEPVFQSAAAWGTVLISDEDIVPESTYDIRADVRAAGEPVNLSGPTSATTWSWGDGDNADGVTVTDLVCVLDGFRDVFNVCTLAATDFEGSVDQFVPDGEVNIVDIVAELDAFSGDPYPGPVPCAPEPEVGDSPTGSVTLELVVPPSGVAGQTFVVEVYARGVTDLRGYQVALDLADPEAGEVIAAHVDVNRREFVFADRDAVTVLDPHRGRAASAVHGVAVTSWQRHYLASFEVRASADAHCAVTLRVADEAEFRDQHNQRQRIAASAVRVEVARPWLSAP